MKPLACYPKEQPAQGSSVLNEPPNEPGRRSIKYQQVWTSFGTHFAFQADRDELVHVQNGRVPLRLVSWGQSAGSGLLCSDESDFVRPVLIGILDDVKNGFTLADPGSSLYYSAVPSEDRGQIVMNRSVVGVCETFTGIALEDASIGLGGVLEGLLARCDWTRLSDAFLKLLEYRAPASILNIIGESLSLTECEYVSVVLLKDARLRSILADTYTDDVWAVQAIPKLGEWLDADRPWSCESRAIGPDLDFLAEAGVVSFASLPMKLNAFCREQVSPRKGPCVIATARNEGAFILDWIAHHKALGFQGFFIYTNDNDDGSEILLEALATVGEIKLVYNVVDAHVAPQAKCYADALQMMPEVLDYSWSAVIDLDEYVFVDEGRFCNIAEFISYCEVKKFDSVGLNWSINLPNGERVWRDRPLPERFPHAGPDIHLKSIFRPRRFMNAHSHFPYEFRAAPRSYGLAAGGVAVNGYPFNEEPEYGSAWVAHFYFKSIEEFIERRTKNRGDQPLLREMVDSHIPPHLIQGYLDVFNQSSSRAPARDCWTLSGAAAEKERLLAIEPVREAATRVIAAYEDNLRRMRLAVSESARFAQDGTPGAELRALMDELADQRAAKWSEQRNG